MRAREGRFAQSSMSGPIRCPENIKFLMEPLNLPLNGQVTGSKLSSAYLAPQPFLYNRAYLQAKSITVKLCLHYFKSISELISKTYYDKEPLFKYSYISVLHLPLRNCSMLIYMGTENMFCDGTG